ncbi:MAG TPA: hypothetical protein VF635_04420 [Propionibacteriaceae bacterium]|jgi:hypothetical protein
MLDEAYQPHQIPDYGLKAQPALVARMTPQLRLTQGGVVAGLLAVGLSAGALYVFPRFTDDATGRNWALVALVSSIAMLALCGYQLFAWTRAMAEWRGERDFDLTRFARASWVVHLVSYGVVLVALWACIAASVAAGSTDAAAVLLAFALLGVVLAQVLAGVQYLRISGPSGTIPAHLRRLREGISRQR